METVRRGGGGSDLVVHGSLSLGPFHSEMDEELTSCLRLRVAFLLGSVIDWSPLLSLDELARGVSVLFIFSSSLLLVSLIFSFFHFYFIYFSDLHDDAFLLITLDFFL